MSYTREPHPASVEVRYRDRSVNLAPDEALPPEAREAAQAAREALERVDAASKAAGAASRALSDAQASHGAAVDAAARAGEAIPTDAGTRELAEALKAAQAELDAAKRARGALVAEYVRVTARHASSHLAGLRDRVANARRRLDAALLEAEDARREVDVELAAAGWLDRLNPQTWPTVPYRAAAAVNMEQLWPSAATPSLEALRRALLDGIDRAIADALHEQNNRPGHAA